MPKPGKSGRSNNNDRATQANIRGALETELTGEAPAHAPSPARAPVPAPAPVRAPAPAPAHAQAPQAPVRSPAPAPAPVRPSAPAPVQAPVRPSAPAPAQAPVRPAAPGPVRAPAPERAEAPAPMRSAPPAPPAPMRTPAPERSEAPAAPVPMRAPAPEHNEPPAAPAPSAWPEPPEAEPEEAADESPMPVFTIPTPQAPMQAALDKLRNTAEKEPDEFICFNVTEALVEDKADKYIRMFGLCKCARCRIDVIALALSNLPPKYVVAKPHELIPRLSMYEQKYNAAVVTQVMSACKKVLDRPHHERPV